MEGDFKKKLPVMRLSSDLADNTNLLLHEFTLLYSPVIRRCLPEIIGAMPWDKLVHRITMVKYTLRKKRLAISEMHMMLDFLCHILELRMDVGGLFQSMVPIVVQKMIEAEREETECVWQSASKVLLYLARDSRNRTVMKLMDALQACPSCSPPLSAVTTLAAVLSDTTVHFIPKVYVLFEIYTEMEAVTHPRTQRALSMCINNIAVAFGSKAIQEPNIRLLFTKACAILTSWETQNWDCAEVRETITTTIDQVLALLAAHCSSLTPPCSPDQEAKVRPEQLFTFGPAVIYQTDLQDMSSHEHECVDDFAERIVQTGDWKEILGLLRPLCDSHDKQNTVTSVTVCASLMAYPECQSEDLYSAVIEDILPGLECLDINTRLKVFEYIDSFTRASPNMATRLRTAIIKTLLQEMKRGYMASLTVVLRILVTIVQMQTQIKYHSYDEILSHSARHLTSANPVIQLHATKLFAEIVQRCRACSPVTGLVKEHCLSLLVMLHSDNSDITSAAGICLIQSFPHLGCKAMIPEKGSKWNDTRYLHAIYLALAEKHLLKTMLCQAVKALMTFPDPEAVVRHIISVTDFMPYGELAPSDLSDIFMGLQNAINICNPGIREAAKTVSQCLSEKWKCLGTVRQGKRPVYVGAWWRTKKKAKKKANKG